MKTEGTLFASVISQECGGSAQYRRFHMWKQCHYHTPGTVRGILKKSPDHFFLPGSG